MEKTSWYGRAVLEECLRLRKSLQPLSEQYYGPLEQASAGNTLYPFVLLLGNHSSGKSSFINFVLNRKVQMTGVAPTDDCFTIIGSGEEDLDRNGPALVGDPDLGFSGLKTFGPILVNHTQLKVRTDIAVKDFMIVDTPGMIDSPVSRNNVEENLMDRGYNFEGVCRWYAERADVILLFFDPDKPGTTGETLSILTNSLVGFDHKLLIILNKADQFHRIHDFARAYGSLCWNLSKVIPRKDLPRIHTMCLPSHAIAQPVSSTAQTLLRAESSNNVDQEAMKTTTESPTDSSNNLAAVGNTPSNGRSFFDQGILDLEEGRAEVVREAFNAPKRRVDNEISRLFESVTALNMHLHIVDEIVRLYHSELWQARLWSVGSLVLSVLTTVGVQFLLDRVSFPSGAVTPTVEPVSGDNANSNVKAATAASGSGGNKSTNKVKAVEASVPSPLPVPSTHDQKPISTIAATREFITTNRQTLLFSTGTIGTLTTAAITLWRYTSLHYHLQDYKKREKFDSIVKSLYAKELTAKDAFTTAVASQVIDHMTSNVTPAVIEKLQRVPKKEFTSLHRIINEDIANLRRRASPSFPSITPPMKHLLNPPPPNHSMSTNVATSPRDDTNDKDDDNEEEIYSMLVDVGTREGSVRAASDQDASSDVDID